MKAAKGKEEKKKKEIKQGGEKKNNANRVKKCHLLRNEQREEEEEESGGRGVKREDGFIAADPNVKYIQLIMTFIRFSHGTFKPRLPAGKHSPVG